MNETAKRTPQALLDEATRYLHGAERARDCTGDTFALIGIGYALAALAETLQAVMVDTNPRPMHGMEQPEPNWGLRVFDPWRN